MFNTRLSWGLNLGPCGWKAEILPTLRVVEIFKILDYDLKRVTSFVPRDPFSRLSVFLLKGPQNVYNGSCKQP